MGKRQLTLGNLRRQGSGAAPRGAAAQPTGRTSRSLSCSRLTPSHSSKPMREGRLERRRRRRRAGRPSRSRWRRRPSRAASLRCAPVRADVRARAAAPRSAQIGSGCPAPNGPSFARSFAATLAHVARDDPAVDPAARDQVLRRDTFAACASKASRKAGTAPGSIGDAGGVLVAAEPDEVLRARGERVVEVEPLDRPAAPLPHAVRARDRGRPGRWNRSTTRDATIPTTPGCQPGRCEDEAARPRPHARRRVGERLFEDAPLDLLPRLVLAVELLGQRAASAASDVSSSRTPRPASSSRPAALIRGASRNPTCPAPTGVPCAIPATLLQGRARRAAASGPAPRAPSGTRIRLAPTSGTTSATVPSATRSSASLRFGSCPAGAEPARARAARFRSAITSAKVTPTAARSFDG